MPELTPLVDAVMVLTAAEGLVLWAWHRWTGRGLTARDYVLSLLSGLLLMGALRGALTPGTGAWVWACLAGSGVCHALDLRLRWQQASAAQREVGPAR